MTLPPAALARYPFLEEASAWITERGPSLEDLLFDRGWSSSRSRGVGRARAAVLEGQIGKDAATTETEALGDVLSYAVARMLVSCVAHPYAVRRYALAESKRCYAFLQAETEELVAVVAARLGMRLKGTRLHVVDYLRHAVTLRDVDWKLVNQPLSAGWVHLDKRRLARLAEEALRRRIERELPIEPSADVRKALGAEARELATLVETRARRLEAREIGAVDLTCLPPCMRNILAQLQAGVNAPHTARFAVTAFLHTIGMDSEAIMKLFATAPDFKESLTRYQVEHITGKSSGTHYTPPSCGTMQTYGICPLEERDWRCLAPRMHHPLTYYRWAAKDKGAVKSAAREPPAAAPEELPPS